jgi:hypothetical protein
MKIFTCQDHDGFCPVGTASIVFAHSEKAARELLRAALIERGLSPDGFTLIEQSAETEQAIILRDGDY